MGYPMKRVVRRVIARNLNLKLTISKNKEVKTALANKLMQSNTASTLSGQDYSKINADLRDDDFLQYTYNSNVELKIAKKQAIGKVQRGAHSVWRESSISINSRPTIL